MLASGLVKVVGGKSGAGVPKNTIGIIMSIRGIPQNSTIEYYEVRFNVDDEDSYYTRLLYGEDLEVVNGL